VQRPPIAFLAGEVAADPVPAERRRTQARRAAVGEPEAQRRAVRVALAGCRAQPVAQRQPAEPQPLLLDAKLEILDAELVFELALQVVEQVVPAHGTSP
jgi:hypothetical protein